MELTPEENQQVLHAKLLPLLQVAKEHGLTTADVMPVVALAVGRIFGKWKPPAWYLKLTPEEKSRVPICPACAGPLVLYPGDLCCPRCKWSIPTRRTA